ncbi:class I SAM-dependent methyltransferase [Fundidesulfovibrio putealis]|uniref:class I SAM-dependent methyltransferase n=1 Tax=Fundidesulfovibrio putealis TaxID=270496 RepID=UPI0004239324|nr:class I SAM-dependent methyltransferase [Fundidesulfovibrio putealis]
MDIDWQSLWREAVAKTSAVSHVGYWNERANDYDNFIRSSRFAYGEAMSEILVREGMLSPSGTVLEIASGVGAVTLPLAQRCALVTALEPAERMADRLRQNARDRGISNIDVRVQTLEQAQGTVVPGSFDLTLMCHASWQFPEFMAVVEFMDRASRLGGCIADTAGFDDQTQGEMYDALGIKADCPDRFPYLFNLLYSGGYYPNVRMIPYAMRRSIDSALSMWRLLIGKYRTPTEQDLALIESHVHARAEDGMYEVPSVMAVLWWKKKQATK